MFVYYKIKHLVAAVALAVTVMFGGIPQAQEIASLSDSQRAALVEFGGAASAYAYYLGACEHHYDRQSAASALAELTGSDEEKGGQLDSFLRSLWAKSYAKGRSEAKARGWSLSKCEDLFDEARPDVRDTRRVLDREFGGKAR